MSDPDTEQDAHAFQRITPAAVDLSAAAGRDPSIAMPAAASRQPRWLPWAGLGILVLLVAAVIFVLPAHVPQAALPAVPQTTEPAATAAEPAPAAEPQQPASAGPSPWSDAQMQQMRRESQDILEKLLNTQHQLEQMHVKDWAGDDFAHALKLAAAGDHAYQEQKYDQARSGYQQALDALNSLLQRADQVFRESLQQGGQALTDGDSAAATNAFNRALLIRPHDPTATHGIERAASLDQVLADIAAGDQARAAGRLDEARNAYAKALQQDADSAKARQRLADIRTRISDRDFATAMSAGYSALDAGRLEDARNQFDNALRLKPGASAARDGLAQAQERMTSGRIDRLLKQADAQAQSENWDAVVKSYDEALALDPTLRDAQDGKARAGDRAALDLRLVRTIARPDRLTDSKVRDEAAALLLDALAIKDPGPRLQKQIRDLGGLLKDAVKAVAVTLQSDNATQVTVYHVGALGSFDRRHLALKPGHYVAVGSRSGYRDVRVEFDVNADAAPPPVVVQCRDPISMEP